MSSLNSHLRTRRFTEVTFRPSPPTNHWKTQHFAASLTFRSCGSSFYWLSRNCIFFLLTLLLFSAFSIFWLCFSVLLFQLSILSEVRLLNFLRLAGMILQVGGGNSNIFGIFTPIPGEMIQFDEHIFPMGWNHQLVFFCFDPRRICLRFY